MRTLITLTYNGLPKQPVTSERSSWIINSHSSPYHNVNIGLFLAGDLWFRIVINACNMVTESYIDRIYDFLEGAEDTEDEEIGQVGEIGNDTVDEDSEPNEGSEVDEDNEADKGSETDEGSEANDDEESDGNEEVGGRNEAGGGGQKAGKGTKLKSHGVSITIIIHNTTGSGGGDGPTRRNKRKPGTAPDQTRAKRRSR